MSHLNTILLQPTDVLFFRDGRPMGGSLAGHTSAWPLPDVTNHALHAALHRAGLAGVHEHRRGRSGDYGEQRDRKFGSLLTVGPFPVNRAGQWFFPRPKDAQRQGSLQVTLQPVRGLGQEGGDDPWLASSLPCPLEYALANTVAPDKDAGGEPWISAEAFDAYVKGAILPPGKPEGHLLRDDQIADREQQTGIAIDPETQTTGQGGAAGQIYSAHYLRLREGVRLGLVAEAHDKNFQQHDGDLIQALLNGNPEQIVVGGQQRICSASRAAVNGSLPLPLGLAGSSQFHALPHGKFAVKWILLAPAIWPEIPEGTSKRGTARRFHPGGWLPNWICPETGRVLLEQVSADERRRRRILNYEGKGYASAPNINARLVAAIVPKPIPVTGWALANDTDRPEGGAKSTHLAVPAGAVYYFEADSPEEARKLAAALNWHGSDTKPTTIKNRRSTLLGEKGYGLGVCGTWSFWGNLPGRPMK